MNETIYFPHNVDFRGRAYPIPPNLNHMGDDLCRGLLKFAEKKSLGERGLWWLKVHISNLYGFDKAPLNDRCSFTENNLDQVLDSAQNPVEVNYVILLTVGKSMVVKSRKTMAVIGSLYRIVGSIKN